MVPGTLFALSSQLSIIPFPFLAGMAAIESEAYFDSRLAIMGISLATITTMKAKGLLSLADFAFSSSYIPGQGNDGSFVTGVLEVLIGPNFADSPDTPKLRRLYFEAHTLSVADLRRRTERTDSDQPVKLPAEERVVRLARLKRRLIGFDIAGVYEPSHSLIDLMTQMLETSQIKYIPWSACTAREQEVLGVKRINVDHAGYEPDSGGFLRRQPKNEEYSADVTSDLLLTHALFRRAIAFELANICPFEVFYALTTKLMKEYMRPALARYSRVSLEQLENADRHVFVELASFTAGGVGVKADGTIPVQAGMKEILSSPDFQFLLMQMPLSGGSSGQASRAVVTRTGGKGRGDSRSRSRRRKITETQEKNRKAKESNKVSGKGGGKAGRGKASKGKSKGPFDSRTEVGRTVDGSPICFGYNTAGCTGCGPGERCTKGFHVCWKIGCGQAHPSSQHP